MGKNTGLIIWLSVMAGLSSLSAASILGDVVGDQVAALFSAVIAACNTGTAVYVAAVRPLSKSDGDQPLRPV